MCDPSITLKKIYDPKLFTELGSDSEYKIGEILYMYTDDIPEKTKFLSCLQVVEYDPVFIKFLNVKSKAEKIFRRETIGHVSKKFINFHLFRENIFTKRQEYLKLIEGTNTKNPLRPGTNIPVMPGTDIPANEHRPRNSGAERYLRSEDNMREISQYLGGKKYRKKRTKRTKRTNKTNRKKRTRRR